MKRIILIMATAMMAFSVSAQQTTNKTLYIVDGKVVSEEQFKGVKNEDVDNMSVFEGIESAIVITTKKPGVVVIRGEKDSNNEDLKLHVTGVTQAKMDDVIVLDSDTDVSSVSKDPLMLITDGKTTKKIDKVAEIDPKKITHITIIHYQSLGSNAAEQFKKYGDVTNGVTIISVEDIKDYKIKK
ncbi:MAG: hypothetical protein E7138_05170 [Rikenellaceae bacterium]|nr:hypothetical protein [Rikenellaceae bacterium]